MSAGALMSLGMRGLAASYAALQATGHNIANANVAGYSRQSVLLETAQGQFTGAGFFGRGVDVASVTRAHDEFLTREAASARSLAALTPRAWPTSSASRTSSRPASGDSAMPRRTS